MAPGPVSPLAPTTYPALPAIAGFRVATGRTGLRYRDREDLLLVEMAPETRAAGVFTRSMTAAAPVHWCRQALESGAARGLVVNAGNANAFTGAAGDALITATTKAAAEQIGCQPEQIFVASTGVIGEALPPQALAGHLPALGQHLSPLGWDRAAEAIRTTDTFPKLSTRSTEIGGVPVTLNAIAKGSGMIAPDMATMLAFVFTDAALPAPVLQTLLSDANEQSFNRITVDSDTSTSDMLLLFASGQASHPAVGSALDPAVRAFRAALTLVLLDLAHQVVRDGEGANKFIAITVKGAETDLAAKTIAFTVANSPLVKTAIAGCDANWGRIVMAVGKSRERVDPRRLAIAIGGVQVARAGCAVPDYDESPVAVHLKGRDISIEIDLGLGSGRATVWTCDLTHRYIDINASYRS